jgi:DNA modification methylase
MYTLSNHPQLRMRVISELRPDPHHSRKRGKGQIEQIVSAIRRFGFRGAILIDSDDQIIDGHGMAEAATIAGLIEVPTICESFLNATERRAFALANKRLAELSEWDEEKLNSELEFLFNEDGGLEGTGFDLSDLDFSVGDERPAEEAVELPHPDDVAITRLGDLWCVGPHRIYCGDARDARSFEVLLGEELAQLVIGDCPYNVPVDGHIRSSPEQSFREFAFASGELSPAEFTAFLRAIFRNCARFSADGAINYQCMDFRHLREILDAAEGVYTEFKQLVVWVKPTGGQGAFMRSRHELILVFKSGRGRHINNIGLKRYRTNVIEYSGCSGFYRGRASDLVAHPTVKPTAMYADFLLDCSNRGDLVLDPTAGSGTILLAAHRTGRRAAAIEIDPLYVDTALRRLSSASGLVPTLSDGRGFDEVAAARSAAGSDHEG